MNKQLEHKFQKQKFSILLERMESLQYALETLHKKVGLENVSSFENAVKGVEDYYQGIMDDLLFEARSESNYDFKANEWIAFQKKEGKPFLAYAPTLSEAMSLIFEMIQEDKND